MATSAASSTMEEDFESLSDVEDAEGEGDELRSMECFRKFEVLAEFFTG